MNRTSMALHPRSSSDSEEKQDDVPSWSQSTPTYRYSVMAAEDGQGCGLISAVRESTKRPRGSEGSNTPTGRDSVFVRGSTIGRDIEAKAFALAKQPEKKRDYKGRYRVWPGVLVVVLLLVASAALMVYYGLQAHSGSQTRAKSYEKHHFDATRIAGGSNTTGDPNENLVSDDGAIGNPKVYPRSMCELPNYLSKNGHIVAVSSNGTEMPLKIKGINWFGMETGQAIPFGLWDNTENGTTAYQVASFLANNKFNAVRLPLMAASILENKVPNAALLNKQENRGINVKDYLSLLKSIVKVLQYRHIAVLISMHTLTFTDNGKLWYNADVSEEAFLKSIDILTKTLCSNEYWNVMGIDLKNEPAAATWGDGTATDFRAGAKRIADRMLKGCPRWMGFVEGVNGKRTMNLDGATISYYDWYGGGLHGAKTQGLEFSIKDKIVWAPHYYTPAVYPQEYFFGGGTLGAALSGYVELGDEALRSRIKATMNDMFGFLASETGPALLLGEFGGLYAEDKHPMKTTKRCTDFTIEIIKSPGWAGGFVWSLNPESEYQYNPADTPGRFFEGLLQLDWLGANEVYVKGMAAMDEMEDLRPFPCFPISATTSAGRSSASSSSSSASKSE